MRRFRTKLRVNEKPGEGLVTNADLEAERAAIKVLKSAFPDFGILTEESDGKAARSPGRWILDPLDGTTNYAHGLSTFCVSIAAEWDGEIVAGVIYHPVPGETYAAMQGKGAFVFQGKPGKSTARRLRVSSTRELGSAFLSTGFSSRKDRWLEKEIAVFERVSRKAGGVRRPGSAALDLANVARGTFDGFWERGLSAWDVAAGSLLIHEAGGKVTGFEGKALRLDGGEVLASNGLLHRALMREQE
jgi:myo-inositol-1(or 4)-monophosphatase